MLSLIDGPLLLPTPSWVSYEPQAKVLQKRCLWIPTSVENHYKITAKELIKCIEPLQKNLTKVLILNSPNNPTGHVYLKHELEELASVCRDNQILVLNDFIYGFPEDFLEDQCMQCRAFCLSKRWLLLG